MARIWSIGGGKGGSGKSFLVASIGSYLAKAGEKTLLIDADLGSANLHSFIGVPYPEMSISDFLNKEVENLEEVAIQTWKPNLFLISGARDNLEIANMPYAQKVKLFQAIYRLPYEYILLDLGAGTSFNTLDFFWISHSGIFVTTPEPTSIENTYRLIRALCTRRIKQILKNSRLHSWVLEALNRKRKTFGAGPAELVAMVKQNDPETGELLEKTLQALQFKLVVNKLRKRDSANLGNQMCRVCEKHLGLQMQFIGNICYDNLVHDAVCQKASFVDKYDYTQTALDLQAACQGIIAMEKRHLKAHPKEANPSGQLRLAKAKGTFHEAF